MGGPRNCWSGSRAVGNTACTEGGRRREAVRTYAKVVGVVLILLGLSGLLSVLAAKYLHDGT